MAGRTAVVEAWIKTLPTPVEPSLTTMLIVPVNEAKWFEENIGEVVDENWQIFGYEEKEVFGYMFANVFLRRREADFKEAWQMGRVASLEPEEFMESVLSQNRQRLLVMAIPTAEAVWVCRADMKWFTVPKAVFTPSSGGEVVPDFNDVKVGDFGWSLVLGEAYEASSDFVFEHARPL